MYSLVGWLVFTMCLVFKLHITEQLQFVLVLEAQVPPYLQCLLEEMLSLNFFSALSAARMTLG